MQNIKDEDLLESCDWLATIKSCFEALLHRIDSNAIHYGVYGMCTIDKSVSLSLSLSLSLST